MASPFFSSLLYLFLLFIARVSEATEFVVGGSTTAWKIPSSASESLNRWAEANHFQVGDSLVWKYDSKKHAVLQVTREEAYLSCDTSSPIAELKDGNTVVRLERQGPCYFISGAELACEKGKKVIVVVMSSRSRYLGISPAPSPVEYDGAVTPTSGASKILGLNAALVCALVALEVVGGFLFPWGGWR